MGKLAKLAWDEKSPINIRRIKHWIRLTHAPLLAVVLLAMFTGVNCSTGATGTIEAVLVAPPNVPPRVNRDAAHVIVNLEAREEVREIAPGVEYRVWDFNGSVPGPLIRVRVGDTVEIRLRNRSENMMLHNIDLHAVNGPGGGAEATNVAPGEEKSFTFKAKVPGLFVYHCAAGIVADHISNGMYGAILVDGLTRGPAVDREFYVGQHEYYLSDTPGAGGVSQLDSTKLLAEDPTYVVFNGATKALQGDDVLRANTGETVRLYVTNGGPNLISSFHVIGEIFDRAYQYGTLMSPPLQGIQTVLIPPGGAAIVDFGLDVPGDYKLVDHSIARVSKGGLGILHVTGDEDPGTFQDLGKPGAAEPTATSPATAEGSPTPTSTGAPAATATPGGGGGATQEITITMGDNVFQPNTLEVTAGSRVAITLRNEGLQPHNMHIATASGVFNAGTVSVPEVILAGKSGTLTWDVPGTPGTYKFRCDIHPVDMTGSITVK